MASLDLSSERALDPELRLQHALDLAFRYLNRRERTELEMRRYLEDKRVEPASIEEALASLRQQGYLDDARFARQFTEDKRLLEEWGADRIERKLRTLGVSPEVIGSAIAARGREGELEAARALIQRRFPALTEEPRELQRAVGVLVRKGYDAELAWDVVRAQARAAEA
jgi:regulatory protein